MKYDRQSALSWAVIVIIAILTAAVAANSQTLTQPAAPVRDVTK